MLPDLAAVSEKNQRYAAYFMKKLGSVPNLYAAMMHSGHALGAYYAFHTRGSSLSKRESGAITLVVSQYHRAMYCLSAHTMIGKLNGFSGEEIIQLRGGRARFDAQLDALVQLAKGIVEGKGKVPPAMLENFFNKGYTLENLIDLLHVVGDTFITNFMSKVLEVPIDFPPADEIQG